ncbi:MAG: ABC transporter substrate-binding protein [Thermosediminibacteraceae bacterium]|nr:ABC transporter substrate-binding protein [Thermosediminibacteraceae bacterium]
MKRRVLAVLLVLSIVASVLSGCSRQTDQAKLQDGSGDKKGGVLNDYLESDPNGFDVQESTLLVMYTLARQLYSTLLRYKGNTLELEPELLAKMPEISPDGKTYTFELKKGIKFHDGITELVADDVKFTIERMLDPKGKGMSKWLFEPILGAKAFMEGKASTLEGFKKIDDYRFQIILEKPYAPFLHNLAVPAASIYSEKLVKAAGDNWRLNPIGTGPFKLKSYVPNTEIVLEKNPHYFEPGLPYLDGIHYRIVPDATTALMEFENGTLDVCLIPVNEYQRIKDSGKYEVLEGVALNTYYFIMNLSDPMWSDVRLRKAVAMAIDKEKLVEALYGPRGTVAKSFVTPGIPGAYESGTGPAYDYNPEEAKRLVKELGNVGKLQAWQRGGERLSDANVAIQAMLKEVGLDLEINIVESAAFSEARSKGKIPAAYGNWWADIPDPDNYLYTFFARTNQMSSGYNNEKVQDMLEQARNEVDSEKRKELYRKIEEIILREDVAVVPLFHIKSLLATQKNVKGIILHPTGINIYTYAYKE